MGEVARRNSSHLLLHAVDSLAGTYPVMVTGDFNSTPDSEPYSMITAIENPEHLKDARLLSPVIHGPEITYSGFKINAIPGSRIDYVFLKNTGKVLSYSVNSSNNGFYYPSDHLPVIVELNLE